MNTLREIINEFERITSDKQYIYAKNWKEEEPNRVLIGIIPNYIPREVIHAANGLAIGIFSEEILKPYDAKTSNGNQARNDNTGNEPCTMYSGLFELVRSGTHKIFDGFILPTQCHLIQDCNEIKIIEKSSRFVKYIYFPQYFQTIISDILNQYFVHNVLDEIYKINGVKVTQEMLNYSIYLYKSNMNLTEKLYLIRQKYPEKISEKDLFTIVLAGLLIPIEYHNRMLSKLNALLLEGVEDRIASFFEIPSGPYC